MRENKTVVLLIGIRIVIVVVIVVVVVIILEVGALVVITK
jgi:hypothetical protein